MSRLDDDSDRFPFVYIPSENTQGVVTQRGAYGSMVEYSVGGIEYKIFMDNEDLVFLDDLFEYEVRE